MQDVSLTSNICCYGYCRGAGAPTSSPLSSRGTNRHPSEILPRMTRFYNFLLAWFLDSFFSFWSQGTSFRQKLQMGVLGLLASCRGSGSSWVTHVGLQAHRKATKDPAQCHRRNDDGRLLLLVLVLHRVPVARKVERQPQVPRNFLTALYFYRARRRVDGCGRRADTYPYAYRYRKGGTKA